MSLYFINHQDKSFRYTNIKQISISFLVVHSENMFFFPFENISFYVYSDINNTSRVFILFVFLLG